MMLENQTQITEFILLGFGNLHPLLFLMFLIIYLVTMIASILIVVLVAFDQHLHTPMYYFLGNLSFLEACYTSSFTPRILSALLTGNRNILFSRCFTQWYFCGSFIITECCLLCAMSYDRYLAICKPLHYSMMMNSQTFILLAAGSWLNGFTICFILLMLLLQRLTFCGSNEIDHFFCDYFPLLKLSCSDTRFLESMMYTVAVIYGFITFLITLASYASIVSAILKIPSTTGRQKTFSTCSSHLVVVSIFYGSLMFVYMLPKTEVMQNINKFSSLLYTVLPPLVNPFIYSLRNKEVKNGLRNIIVLFYCRDVMLSS